MGRHFRNSNQRFQDHFSSDGRENKNQDYKNSDGYEIDTNL